VKRLLSILSILSIVCAGSARAVEEWRDANYGYRKAITFDAPGANLTDFPCLVYIDGDDDGTADGGEDIGDQVQGDADDLRFYDGDGNALPYEVEQYAIGDYDGDADDDDLLLVCWVQTDLYAAPAGDQNVVWMYYGYGSAGNGEGDPWDANFVGVWHMTDSLNDSTVNAHHLSAGGTPTAEAGGIVGGCYDFVEASTEYAYIDDNLGITAAPLTMEAWFNADGDGNADTLTYLGDKDNAKSMWMMRARGDQAGDHLAYLIGDVAGTKWVAATTNAFTASSWHYAYTKSAADDDHTVTLNADTVNEGTSSHGAIVPVNIDRFAIAGTLDSTPGSYMNGLQDEVRVSNVARSDDWLAFTHANGGGTADHEQTWSAEESAPAGGIPTHLDQRNPHIHGGHIR